MAERDVDVAQFTLDDLGGRQLMPRRDRGEDAGDGDPVGSARDLAQEPRDGVGVQRGQVLPVEFDAAADDHRAGRIALVRSAGQPNIGRMLSVAGRPIRITAIRRSFLRSEHGVRRVSGASMTWVIRCRSRLRGAQHGVDRRGDPAGDVQRARHLGLGDHAVRAIHDHGVGIGAAHIDTEAAVEERAPARSSTGR